MHDKNIKVSVIVLTYNFDVKKLKSTLKSIIMQNDIDFEIIIADDGSRNANFTEIDGFMKSYSYDNYTIVKNVCNQGTVKNLLSGLDKAVGKYVYLTSPGDMLYDSNVLAHFYNFAEARKSKIVFGNAIFYNSDSDFIIYENMRSSFHPESFSEIRSIFSQKVSFFFGNYIIGACYFREHKSALKYFNSISLCCKYVEDNTSTAFALADNVRIDYYDRNMIWYEYGVGVSTAKNDKWKKLMDKDFFESFKKLKENYPKDAVIDAVCYARLNSNKLKTKIYRIVRHPLITLCYIKNKFHFSKKNIVSDEDKERLKLLLKDI